MLIRKSISEYKHFDLGNIKLAFTQVCKNELFRNVYFAANSLYYVETGSAEISVNKEKVLINKGGICLIKQHSKVDIRKFQDKGGNDFKSIIFYLFPDFVADFVKKASVKKFQSPGSDHRSLVQLGKNKSLKIFFESLLPFFEGKQAGRDMIREKTFSALSHLVQHNKQLLAFLTENAAPVKIDLYEFMIHIAINNYSVADLARLTGRSLSAFKRDFYTVFATTPHQWMLRQKIDYAEQLLRDKKMKVSDIYLMLGFNELSHFSAAFSKIKGVSPTRL